MSSTPLVEKKKSVKPFKAMAYASWGLWLNPLALLLWLIDFLVWFLSIVGPVMWLKFYFQGKYSVETDTAVRRKFKGPLVETAVEGEEILTAPALLEWCAVKYGDVRAMGTRTYLGDYKAPGARFPLKKFGETTWLSFSEVRQRALNFGAGLLKLGMEPLPTGADVETVNGPHTLLIFEDTSAEWMTAALGATCYSLVVATSYATLGISSVAEAVRDSSVPVVVTNRKQVDAVMALKPSCPSLKAVVYTYVYVAPENQDEPKVSSGVQVCSFEGCVKLGVSSPVPPVPPTPEAVALIMYTSGSTGKPKGVMIKHKSICSSVGGLSQVIGTMSKVGDTYLGYLPQAHILEFCAELTCLRLGVNIGYADPRTLSSTGAVRQTPSGEINAKAGYPYPPGAIQEFRPAFMAGVPKIWDILKKSFEDTLGKKSAVERLIFQIAYSGRARALRQHREAPFLKFLVFRKLTQMLGGNLKATVSGGGAIASEVQTFVRTAFACPAVQGYALTETCCSATFQMPDDSNIDGVVGAPLTSVEIKLESVDITDAKGKKYLSTDTYHMDTACRGRGEILIRGPPISAGYFKMPDKTDEVFTSDGWFHTGDVGVWRTDGQLKIVDRVKNLVKLKGGEYIAIENMEKEYSTSAYVSGANGGILCYGDGDMDRPIAFVVVDEKKLAGWAGSVGLQYGDDFPALCATPEANAEVLRALVKAGKDGNLGPNEILAACLLLPGTGPQDNQPAQFNDPWTPENGMLTASNKLNRKPIVQVYGAGGKFDALKAKGIK